MAIKKSIIPESQKDVSITLKDSEQRNRTIMMSKDDALIATDKDGIVEMMNPAAEKLSEKQLESQNAILNALINSPKDMIIFSLDKNYCYTSFNEKHREEMSKIWSVEIALGENLLNYMRDETLRNLAKQSIDRTIQGDSFSEIQHQPGYNIYYEFNWEPVIQRKQITGVAVFIRDITQQINLQNSLREKEELYRTLYENSTVGIYRTSPDGKILMANPTLVKLLGYTSFEKLSKRNLEESGFEPSYERARFIEMIESKGTLKGLESSWTRFDGEKVFVSESARAIRDENGKTLYYDGIVEDITLRKKAEEALLLKNFVFDDSIAANSIADINGIITEANDAFVKLWGYPNKKNVIGRTITSFLKNSEEAEIILTALQKTGEWEGDYSALRKDNSTFYAHGLATTINDVNGNCIGYQSSVLDVTERINQEEEIRKLNDELEQRVILRTHQLEAANKELEAFSYSVSHDLRAPLRAIHGYTNILMEEYEDKLDDEGKRLFRIVHSSASQMGELIDDLLNLSRIGRSSMTHSLIDMNQIINSVFDELTSQKEKEKIILNIENLDNGYGDSTLIKQVWVNLISNAIKYSSKNEVQEITIGSEIRDKMIIYAVKDNGVGFDMLYKHKLFGAFQRLHTAKEFEGNGVGLAIVNRIINKHGGNVWAESETGKGASFYFSLPVRGDGRQTKGDKKTTRRLTPDA